MQAFYLANVYHDHLANSSIGFDAADGNFAGDDPVEQNTDDGAAAGPGGGPDGDHVNNANMSTPPDGISPRMQMYLFATNPSGRSRSATSTAATTPARCGTSTPTACPTVS